MRRYCGQNGWDGFRWGGVGRTRFRFSDSLQAGRSLLVGEGEGKISITSAIQETWMAEHIPTGFFAGIVCVAN